MKIIMNDTRLPFTSNERRIIASIARYHRKGLPKRKHYNLATLSRKTVAEVSLLSSLLRVADALDYSHQSAIKGVEVKCSLERITVEYVASSKSPMDEEAFNKKKELFENVFKKQLVLGWKQQ
jgi:exopolyphosphatase/pppGpp-phosphohydrolase